MKANKLYLSKVSSKDKAGRVLDFTPTVAYKEGDRVLYNGNVVIIGKTYSSQYFTQKV